MMSLAKHPIHSPLSPRAESARPSLEPSRRVGTGSPAIPVGNTPSANPKAANGTSSSVRPSPRRPLTPPEVIALQDGDLGDFLSQLRDSSFDLSSH